MHRRLSSFERSSSRFCRAVGDNPEIFHIEVPSLARGKCLDADGIAIFAMDDHYGFVMPLLLCHPVFAYANRQVIDAHIPWQPYMRI